MMLGRMRASQHATCKDKETRACPARHICWLPAHCKHVSASYLGLYGVAKVIAFVL